MATNPTPKPFMDDLTAECVDNSLAYVWRASMNAAADPHRTPKSRGSLLLNGCDMWQAITEHRREWRLSKAGA